MSVSTTVAIGANQPSTTTQAAPRAVENERRRRRRVKMCAPVLLRSLSAAADSGEMIEEVGMTVNMSRDGLLVTAGQAVYHKGQRLSVMFPYSKLVTALNDAQPAEVVRVEGDKSGKTMVAIRFLGMKSESAASHGAGHHAAKSSPDSSQEPSMVLAIEPDAHNAETLRSHLEDDGYSVVTVSSASEALEILRTKVPAAFIAEVEHEEMSGHDLCLIIKRNERLQRVPVILLTRSAKPADYAASHELGAVVCMAKPCKVERLQHVIHLVAPPRQRAQSATPANHSGARHSAHRSGRA